MSHINVGTGFENLDAWKRSVNLSVQIHIFFKDIKDYGFKDQITRSSLSIPSTIAEGYERLSINEKIHFYSFAKGSSGELRTQILIGMKIGYIDNVKGKTWINETRELSSMIVGLNKSSKNR